jgi:hypothetical protein
MGFIIRHDFDQLITQTDIDVLTGADDHILTEAERSTQLEVKSYLRARFDVASMFPDVITWTNTRVNTAGELVFLTAPNWAHQLYTVGETVNFDNEKIYRCILNTTTSGNNENPNNATYWELIGSNDTLYLVDVTNTAEKLNDVSFFTENDPRDALLIRLMVDLMLYEIHSRINPRMIPELRIQRRDDVIKYLSSVADPRKNIDPGFPLIDFGDDRGVDISFGVTTNNNIY